jgi:predicted ATPase
VIHEFQRKFGDIIIDLTRAEARLFVEQYLDSEPNRLGAGFRTTLYRQTRGHPLFTVELLRGMQERGDLVPDDEGRWVEGPSLDWERLPARVEAVIAERVDRLDAPSQAALRVASVEGETFTAEVVARVLTTDAREVITCLSGELEGRHRLVRAQEIQRLGAQRLSRYRFRHIQFQNYLYHSLDPVERAHLHEAVGSALEGLYGEERDEIALPLARHFQEAGIAEKGVAYLLKAGERAQRGSAHEAAITHLTQGLELLKTLPGSPERARRELELQIALGVPLVLTKGHVAPEVEALYARARQLCEGIGEAPQLFQVLLGLRRFYLHRAALGTAREMGEQLLTLSHRIREGIYLSRAHMMQGEVLYRGGEFPGAREHYERAIALYAPQEHRTHLLLYGNDTGTLSQIVQALVLWQLGRPDQALSVSLEGLSRARELAHPFTLACALYFSAVLRRFRREVPAVQELTEELLRISRERGFALYLAWGTVLRGWALAEQGKVQEGAAHVQQGLEEWRGMGAELLLPEFLASLAEAHGKMGQIEKGLGLLADALERIQGSSERCWAPELQRLKGELSLLGGGPEAEACFERALEAARRQRARSWELRAAISLSRLWQKQGKGAAAKSLLQKVYDAFSEGFETADLQQARALLEALG